jgi:hypothetical protein
LINFRGEEGVILKLAGVHAAIIVIADAYEHFGIGDRQILHQHRVNQREDGCVSADAERERDYCGCGEARSLTELAERVTNVLRKLLEPNPAPSGMGIFLRQSAIAKRSRGGMAGFVGGHAGGDVLGNLLLEMELEFLVEFAGVAFSEKQPLHACPDIFEHGWTPTCLALPG